MSNQGEDIKFTTEHSKGRWLLFSPNTLAFRIWMASIGRRWGGRWKSRCLGPIEPHSAPAISLVCTGGRLDLRKENFEQDVKLKIWNKKEDVVRSTNTSQGL